MMLQSLSCGAYVWMAVPQYVPLPEKQGQTQ
jgi:hypothetical protein